MDKIDAVLRVELGKDPKILSDADWAKYFNEWLYSQNLKSKVLKTTLLEVVDEVFKALKQN